MDSVPRPTLEIVVLDVRPIFAIKFWIRPNLNTLNTIMFFYRSEGEAERDIGSPCMIGLGLVVVEKFFRRRRPLGGGTPENLKIQVTEVSRYEVFGESGWRGSIRLVELVS